MNNDNNNIKEISAKLNYLQVRERKAILGYVQAADHEAKNDSTKNKQNANTYINYQRTTTNNRQICKRATLWGKSNYNQERKLQYKIRRFGNDKRN